MTFINIEIGDMPTGKVYHYLQKLKEIIDSRYPNEDYIICPTRKGVGHVGILSTDDHKIIDFNDIDLNMDDAELGKYIKEIFKESI